MFPKSYPSLDFALPVTMGEINFVCMFICSFQKQQSSLTIEAQLFEVLHILDSV